MYSMVLMAALTTGTDMPDMGGRRGGGGCCGCSGGMAWGGGYGGCYGGWGGGYGGCYGGGWGGGCGGYVRGGYGMGRMGGYGGYVMSGVSPMMGGYASVPMMGSYASAPMIYNSGTPVLANNMNMTNPATQSFFFNPNTANRGNEATIRVHLPADATLTIDGQPTRSTSNTRTFLSPPLQPGKTYTYTLRAETNRDGRNRNVEKTVDVQAGQTSDVTLDFGNANRDNETSRPTAPRGTAPGGANPVGRTVPPRDQ
ncbi:MAG TPA: TIGR03000 domain-containing protein [Gemmataceae bacterium]|jgi:uncharacterized protein (TIGR03000 family)